MPRTKPSRPRETVCLADIAAKVKLSKSGVSRALRNDPTIPLVTCRRVQATARKLGFVLDRPLAQALQLVRSTRKERIFGTIGFIDAWPLSSGIRSASNVYLKRIKNGADERARELGYRLEVFSLMEPGMSAQRVQGILEARGIQGLLIAPLPPDVHELPIEWERFTCVALTHSLQNPGLHRVLPHQYQAASLALHQLQQSGYRRVGFVTTSELDLRVNHLFRAAYLSYQYMLLPEDRLPVLMAHGPLEDTFDEWLKRSAPDAILGCVPGIVELMTKRGLGDFKRVGFVGLGIRPDTGVGAKAAYVDQNTTQVARVGVDQVVAQVERRERGVPLVANVVMIEGTWVPGTTLRDVARK
ncbi:MAG: LacI family transcriptional regulator [Verrucomicrobia bacterium]|nr:LacI family transcriptional regulator [Verrucomicrobiota bacterium]